MLTTSSLTLAIVPTLMFRENAKDVYPADNWQDRWIGRLARGAALTIHGPSLHLTS